MEGGKMYPFFFLLLVFHLAAALTDAEMKEKFTKFILKCTETNPVDMSDLMELTQLKAPVKKEVKCLLACAYKTEGSMDSKGMYDINHALTVAEKTKSGDEKRYSNAKKLAEICAKVNNESVSDGEAGCDRAALIFKCVVENGPKLGFKM